MTSILGIALLSGAFAHAGGLSEVSVQLGTFGAPDSNWWQMFADNGTVPGSGLRVAWRLGDGDSAPLDSRRDLEIVVDWDHQARGSSFEIGTEDTWYDEPVSSFHAKFVGNRFAVGPRLSYRLGSWFVPYATVQAAAWQSRIAFDEDIDDDENPNQFAMGALTGAGIAMLGFDVRPITIAHKVRVGSHLEMGYGYALPMRYRHDTGAGEPVDVGSLHFRGFVLNWGVGVRL